MTVRYPVQDTFAIPGRGPVLIGLEIHPEDADPVTAGTVLASPAD